jgi:hypothetical protein
MERKMTWVSERAQLACFAYVCLVGDDADYGGHENGIYEGEAGCSLGPSEVLVSVRGHCCWKRMCQ